MTDKKLIEQARAHFKQDVEDEREIRDEARKDVAFRAGEQWDPRVKKQREDDARPALTFDKTHVYIQSVVNEARQNKPQPKVNAIGGGATTDVANVINGILRHIQYRSKADIAYDTALDYSCGSSFGFIRAITEYADSKSLDQEVRILPVLDPFSIYGVLIPAARGQECKHALVVQSISKEDYKAEYGDDENPVDFESSEWKDAGDWSDGKNVRIAEYWYCETTKKTLRHVDMGDGTTKPIHTDADDYNETLPFVIGRDGAPIERDVDECCVKFFKMDGTRILPGTKTEWVGDSIPIVAVLGQQLIVDGEVKLFSLIRFIRDAQQAINALESAIQEKIGLSNRVPYLGYKGQFTDPKWIDANRKNYAFLESELVVLPGGAAAPLPQRQQLEEQITALSEALRQQIDNLKSGMGIFDASLGAKGNETSGVGINQRQQQSNVTNFHFSDNLNRGEWELCSKLLKVIPEIYDRPGRQVRIVGEDQQHSVVVVNQPYPDPETGKEKHYPLDVGDYDVIVTVGPSYTTARAEGADTLAQFFKAAPQTVQILADLWVGSLDYPWAREGARRLKAAAPSNIVNEPEQGAMKIPPQIQQQLEKMGQDLQQAHAFAQSLHEQLQSKQPEIDARVKIAEMQELTKRTIALATIDSQEGLSVLENELQIVHKKVDAMNAARLQSAKQQHDAAMAQTAQTHQAGMARNAQDAASASQGSDQAHQADMQASQQDAAATSQQSAQDAAAEQMPKAA